MEIKLQDDIYAVVENDLRDDFDHTKTKVTITYTDKSPRGEGKTKSIDLVVSNEFITDTFGTTKISDNDRLEVAKILVKRIFDERQGIPYGIRSVVALKVYAPLVYNGDINMESNI